MLFFSVFFISCFFSSLIGIDYTVIKELDGLLYVGGLDFLAYYDLYNTSQPKLSKHYSWDVEIMNGSDIGFIFFKEIPVEVRSGPSSLAFDNCLNWKDQHTNQSLRNISYDATRSFYHTMSGNWISMNYTCSNNFIKGIELYDDKHLWICGTFGTFPRAFIVDKITLEFKKFVDMNIMSCARYIDEPVATYRDKSSKRLYIASGWGLYKPDSTSPDIPDNDSFMMYADWRLYRNLFTLPGTMAWVLSSDVNFINVVKETDNFLYFFGHEINKQYGLNNQEDRNAWQSFMLRICKTDPGLKYVPTEVLQYLDSLTSVEYNYVKLHEDFRSDLSQAEQSYNSTWYKDQLHLPTTHFTSPLKVNFGCFMGRKPRSISDNHYWGDTNVIYLNRLADVIFEPNKSIKFYTHYDTDRFGCKTNMSHSQLPFLGLFNSPGLLGSKMEPAGALCQLQINENIFQEVSIQKEAYQKLNFFEKNAYSELMSLSSTSTFDFHGRTVHRTNGYTLYPYWNQGVVIGESFHRDSYKNVFEHVGKCVNQSSEKISVYRFLYNMNFSNTAWPNELPNRLTSRTSAVCQYSVAELYSFNATFIVPGVEFKRMFLIRDNITDYFMHNIKGVSETKFRRFTSPLMVVGIISTSGNFYRVVLCDFDSGMVNYGPNQNRSEWFNWCIFRNTDQPYLYRQYSPMERRDRQDSVSFRASSLLQEKKLVQFTQRPNNDPQEHVIKDVLRKDDTLHIVSSKKMFQFSLLVSCPSYLRCIDCASDPSCMWNIAEKKCEKYISNIDEGYFIQDVLDRGFRCGEIPRKVEEVEFQRNEVVSFYCFNSAFWRGKIVWKVKDEVIGPQTSNIVISEDGSILTILGYTDTYEKISCFGIRDDLDRLYKGLEYEYLDNNIISDEEILNIFKEKKPNIFGTLFYICIFLSFLVVTLVAYILYPKTKYWRFTFIGVARGKEGEQSFTSGPFLGSKPSPKDRDC